MNRIAVLAVVFLGSLASERLARAQVENLTEKATERARRSVSIGPLAGGGLVVASEGGVDGVVSFGLGLFWFKDSLLDLAGARADIQERVEQRVKARLAELGLDPAKMTEQELSRQRAELLRELRAELRAELQERLDERPSATPRPRLNLHLEGAYLPRAGAWQVRAGLGFGISRISLAPTLSGYFGDVKAFGLGGELAFHYLMGKSVRPLALQFFLRYDYYVNNRDALGHQGALGVRALFDLI